MVNIIVRHQCCQANIYITLNINFCIDLKCKNGAFHKNQHLLIKKTSKIEKIPQNFTASSIQTY
jgi:hypothetical protein